MKRKIGVTLLGSLILLLGIIGVSNRVHATTNNGIQYRTHVQNKGWQGYVKDGVTSGTSGKALRLEAIQIKNETGLSGNIYYKTHIQNLGWEKDFKKNNAVSGTSGKALRLEAIQLKIDGALGNTYDIYYRVHAQNFGWLGWAKNGASAGTEGYAYRLEAIQIKLIKKGGVAPGSTAKAFVKKEKPTDVSYRTHVQTYGWQSYVKNGTNSGTTGKAKRLEGVNIKLSSPYSGNIEYRTHIQSIGWESTFKKNGAMSGTSGRALRLEAIQIKLSGDISNYYDVYYRVHAQNFGWMGWAKNGASAGTAGYAYRLEAIQIKLIKKGTTAPALGNAFKEKSKTVQKYNVVVTHKGTDKVLETEKAVQVIKDANHVAKAKSFDGYTLKGNQTQTVKITKDTTITFNYDKVQPIADKTELQKVYNELMNSVELNDYTKDSGNLFRKNTNDVKNNVLDKKDVSQNEVEQAIRTLNNLKLEMVSIKDLRLKINNMNQLDKLDYTESSWIAMNDVLKEANSVLIKSDATQKEVDKFVNKLEEVSADLVNIKVLKAKIDSLYTIAMEDYTKTSWNKFSEILKVAKDIVVQEDVSQENVDSTVKELEEGHSQLVNIKKLRDKVDELKKVQNENYTDSSWKSFKSSLESAISMLENSNASQNDINTVLSELTYHYSKLEENPKHIADKKWLQELYDAVKDKDLSVYTDGSGEELHWALSGAKSYLESPEATQYEVDRAHSELLKANNNLVVNYDLKQVYNTVSDSIKNLDLSNYNDWQVKALKEALEEAKAILDERAPTQRKVDDSKMALEDAFKDLEVARCVISIICRDENGNMVGRTDWSAEKGTYFDAEYLDIAFHGYVIDDEPVKRILVTDNMEVDFKYKKANSEEIEMGSIRKKMREDTISVWRTYRKENGKSDISESQEIQSVANAKAIEFGENPNYEISNDFPSILDSYISKEIIVKAENVTLEWIRSNGTEFIMNEWKKSPEAVDSLLYQDESKNWAEGALACNIVPSSDGKYNVYFVGLIGFTKYQTA